MSIGNPKGNQVLFWQLIVISQQGTNYTKTITSINFMLCARHDSKPLLRVLLLNPHTTSVCWEVLLWSPFSDDKQRHKEMPQNTVNITHITKCGFMARTMLFKGKFRFFTTVFHNYIKMQFWLGWGKSRNVHISLDICLTNKQHWLSPWYIPGTRVPYIYIIYFKHYKHSVNYMLVIVIILQLIKNKIQKMRKTCQLSCRYQTTELGINSGILFTKQPCAKPCYANVCSQNTTFIAKAHINTNLYVKGLANNPLVSHILPNIPCKTSSMPSKRVKSRGPLKLSLSWDRIIKQQSPISLSKGSGKHLFW